MLKATMQAFAFVLFALEPPPAAEIIQRAIQVRRAQEEKGWQFTWRDERVQFRPDKAGRLQQVIAETHEVIMLEGETYRKLVLVDGQPLDAKTQRKVNEEMEKERAGRRKRGSLRTIRRSVRLGGLDELEKLYDCRVAGEEESGGRQAWRIEAEPKLGSTATTRRTYWFDQAEGVELKHLEHFLRATNGFQPGSELEMTYAQFAGAWLPEHIVFRFNLKALGIVRARGETRHHLTSYQRFQVESTLTTPND